MSTSNRKAFWWAAVGTLGHTTGIVQIAVCTCARLLSLRPQLSSASCVLWCRRRLPPSPALAAIQNVATSLTTSLALWGTYITDFVADVAGEDTDDASDEEMAASQKQK